MMGVKTRTLKYVDLRLQHDVNWSAEYEDHIAQSAHDFLTHLVTYGVESEGGS